MCRCRSKMAITDGLTGLHNRRYMETHLGALVEQAALARQAACGADARHRLSSSRSTTATATTPATTCCANSPCASASRSATSISPAAIGGEEFVIVMPETDMAVADDGGRAPAPQDRHRAVPDPAGPPQHRVTMSIGIAALESPQTPRRSCSSAPTRRSIAPSATAATGWSRTPPDKAERGSRWAGRAETLILYVDGRLPGGPGVRL